MYRSIDTLSNVVIVLLLFGCSHGSEETTWVATTENGDKPGIAFVLVEKAGKVVNGKCYVLDPQYPRDLSKGLSYDLQSLVHEGMVLTCKASLLDESSPTRRRNLNLTIRFLSEFGGDAVEAELQSGQGEGSSVSLHFDRKQ